MQPSSGRHDTYMPPWENHILHSMFTRIPGATPLSGLEEVDMGTVVAELQTSSLLVSSQE